MTAGKPTQNIATVKTYSLIQYTKQNIHTTEA